MKEDKKEIYEISKKILSESSFGLRNFLSSDEFAPIRDNPYVMKRSNKDLAAFILFDFKDFDENSNRILSSLLESRGISEDEIKEFINLLKNSFVSLFKIEKKEDHYLFYDCLLDEYIEVELDPDLELSKDKFGLVRLFGEGKRKMILQVVQMMDEKYFFAYENNVNNFFLHIEDEFGPFDINREFVKRDLLNLLAIYEVTYENLKKGPDLDDLAISEFERILDTFNEEDLSIAQDPKLYKKIFPGSSDEFVIGFFLNLFSKIYKNSLEAREEKFSNYDLKYKEIIRELCEGGSFLNREELSNSINFLIIFYSKILSRNPQVKNIIKDLGEIQENIFYYINLLENSQEGFYFDDKILEILGQNKNSVFSNKFIENFDNFIYFLDMNYVSVLKSGDLSPSKLKDFVNSIDLVATNEVKSYKNKHFPLIELYLNFMVKKYLTLIEYKGEKEDIYLTDVADEYLILDDVTKLSIWIESLTNKDFLKSSFGKNYETYKDFVVDLMKELNEKDFIDDKNFNGEENSLINILKDLGIINYENDDKIKITKFGKDIYDYYKTEEINSNNVIEVDFK